MMLNKDDGSILSIVDALISIVEFLVDLIGGLLSGDTSLIENAISKLTG